MSKEMFKDILYKDYDNVRNLYIGDNNWKL
jgi:hypothetical protein